MASLSSQSIASSYEQLLHVDRDGGGNGTTLVDVKDGDNGTTFALKLAQFHAEIRGTTGTGATGAGKLNLSTAELTVVDNDVLGRIDFLAPLESSGTDAILAGASIWGEAEDTFAADNNSTALVFATNTSAAATERMRLTSGGSLGIGTDSPDKLLHLKSSGSESPCIKIENNNDDQYPPRIQFVKDVGNDAEADYDQLGSIAFRGQDTNNNLGTFAHILGKSLDVTDSTEDGQLVIDVMKNNDADGVQVFIDPVGFDVYGTPLKVFGANTSHETSALCISQDTSALSQIRAYGADDSTAGTLEFRMTSSAGAVNQGVMKLDVNSRISLSNNDSGGTGGSDSLSANTFLGYLAGQDIADGGGDNTYFGHKSGNNNATGTNNTSFGSNAAKGSHGNSHSYNTAVGADALLSISTGNYNVAVGSRCADALTDGHQNTFVGDFAGGTTTSVGFATALGHGAMGSGAVTSAADYTVAVGTNALENLTSGADCLAIGGGALGANTTGNHNLAIGRNSLNNLNHANSVRNIAIGAYSGDGMGTLDGNFDNVFIGYGSGGGTWTGAASKGNIGIGTSAMDANMNTAYYNTAVGNSALSGLTSGDDNVAIGGDAGKQLTSGDDNTFVGFQAGTATGSGSSNVAVGHTALATQANASAVGNVAVGASALKDMNGAHIRNIAIGLAAMENASTATTFQDNVTIGAYAFDDSGSNDQTGTVAIGSYALTALAAGTDNTAVGYKSLFACNAGTQNTALGTHALYGTDDGVSNTAVGAYAMHVGNAGDSNTAIGAQAMIDVTGSHNVAVGFQALFDITSGGSNIAIGSSSMKAMVGGESDNIAIGVDSMALMDEDNETIDKNVAIGTAALKGGDLASTSNDYEHNVAIGYQAMDGTGAIGGSENIGIGSHALGGSWTGGSSTRNIGIGNQVMDAAMNGSYSNIGMGSGALSALTTGDCNIAIGAYLDGTYDGAMTTTTLNINCVAIGTGTLQLSNHTASDGSVAIGFAALRELAPSSGSQYDSAQTAIGHLALTSTTSGTQNTAVGFQCLYSNTTGLNNTALGHKALRTNVDGDNNVAIGSASLYTFEASSDGDGCNTAVGANSGYLVSTGQDNVLIGENAGWINGGTSLTTGSGNTLVGYQAAIGAADATNRTAIGKGATAVGDNSVTLGNADVTAVYMAQNSGATVHCGSLDLDNQTLNISATYIAANIGTKKTLGTTDASDNITGIKCHTEFEDAEFFGNLTGADIKAAVNTASSGESLDVTGALIEAEIASYGSTDVNNVYGLKTVADIDGNTVDSNVYGQYIDVDIESGGTISGSVFTMNIRSDADTNPAGEVDGIYNYMATNADWAYVHYDGANSTNRVLMSAAGQIDAEGTINASQSLDYAEYFESKDGKVIASGTSVKLDGDKIVPCSDGDTPLGVIRPKSAQCIVGGGQIFHWKDRFVKDDYGADVWESYTLTKWSEEITFEEYSKRGKDETGGAIGGIVTDSKVEGSKAIEAKDAVLDEDGKELEPAVKAVAAVPDKYYREHKYHSDRLPSGVTAPKDAETITPAKKRQKLNPDYDVSKSYKSREERDEWHVVGLLGQIPVTKGQPTGSWIKMKDVSDTVEMYFVK